MTLKSVVRRGALATVAAASAVALAACGAGQVSQTANQVAAVDGAQNEQDAIPGGVAIRDAHIVVDPESGDAALKFSVTNQERANDVVYTLKSIDVEGAGEVKLTPVASTKTYQAAKKGDRSIPRNCQLVADYAGAVEQYSKAAAANQACITYMSTSLDSKTLTGEKTSAAGENRNVTFTFEGPKGTEKIEMFVTISSFVPEAGSVNRGEDGMAEGAKAAESTAGKTPDGTGDAETSSATDPYTGQIYQ